MTRQTYVLDRERVRDRRAIVSGRRRWGAKRGDRVLIVTKEGSDVVFQVLHEITEVSIAESTTDGTRTVEVTASLDEGQSIEQRDNRLAALKYSLEKISNLATPQRQLQSRSRLSEHDVEVIVTGRIDPERTLYLGVLENLPDGWRQFLDRSARARHELLTEPRRTTTPWDALRPLLEYYGIQLASFATAAARARRELHDVIDGVSIIDEPEWDVQGMLDRASDHGPRIETLWHELQQRSDTAHKRRTTREGKWKPHHW